MTDWTIAAAMLNFPSVDNEGRSRQDASGEVWLSDLRQVAEAGFSHVDPTDSWLRVADLVPARRAEFASAVAEAGLQAITLSTARRSVIDPEAGDENLAYSHRVIEAASELGMATVSFGLFRPFNTAQQQALWFWTAQGPVDHPDQWDLAVRRLTELGRHAADAGIDISLEMYEDTFLGSADSSIRLVEEIGLDNVGLNPDLGNLLRLHRPIEHWQRTAEKVLPYANYWHVKNYSRVEDANSGVVFAVPTSLELGTINYRWAVNFAIDHGFEGAFCVEHYGGDGLSVSASNRDYLRRILKQPMREAESCDQSL